jgi:hypothetical protein
MKDLLDQANRYFGGPNSRKSPNIMFVLHIEKTTPNLDQLYYDSTYSMRAVIAEAISLKVRRLEEPA